MGVVMAEGTQTALILNVDDDDAARYAITKVLERGGYGVIEAADGAGALEGAASHPVDVVVLDVNLPDLSGFEVAKRLKGDPATADIPILHLSASARDPGSLAAGLEAAEAYLTEPVSPEALLGTVGALVRARRALEEARRRAGEAEAAEAALQRYRLLSEHAHDIMLFIRPDGRIAEANAAAAEAYGYSREELLGRNIRELRAAETAYEVAQQIEAADKSGVVFETVHRRKDGSTFPVEVSSRGADIGGERLLVSIIRDISERKQVEEALRASEERRRLAQAAAKAGTWEWDLRTNENLWSEEVWGLYGLQPRSCTPSYAAWRETIHPDDRELVEQAVQKAAREGTELNVEWRVRDRDGAERWLMSRGQAVRDAQGQMARYIGIVVDVTQGKRAEEAIRRSEAILAQVGEMAHLGAWEIEVTNREDLNANPLVWSEEVYRIFGYEPGAVEVTNELFFRSIPPEDQERVVAAVAEAMATRQPYSIEHRVLRPDGTERIVQEHADMEYDEEGRVVRIVGGVQDITEAVRERERAAAAERARAELAETLNAEIAHRTKNNLTMAASVLRLQAKEETDARTVNALNDAASRLLTFASVHEQLQTTQEGEIDFLAALERIAEATREVYAANEVEFSVAGERVLLPSRLATSLAVVANELVTNAAKHGCMEGATCQVRVRLTQECGALLLSVWNSGARLPEGFEVAKGAHLGLRLVMSLVEQQYGGRFSLRPEGEGTCAEVVVPLDREAA